jgi:hypothetical protein
VENLLDIAKEIIASQSIAATHLLVLYDSDRVDRAMQAIQNKAGG